MTRFVVGVVFNMHVHKYVVTHVHCNCACVCSALYDIVSHKCMYVCVPGPSLRRTVIMVFLHGYR